jgi:hypothetical protein
MNRAFVFKLNRAGQGQTRITGTKPMKISENKSKLAALAATPCLAIAFALAVGAFTQQAAAKPPTGGGPAGNSNNSFAVGGITTYDGHVAFAAQKNPNTGNSTGHVVQDSFGVSRSGPVDCLTVVGNHATILWHVTHSDNTGEIGQQRLFEMCDEGEPTGGVPPDFFYDWGNSNTNCQEYTYCGSPFIHGNIVVKGP